MKYELDLNDEQYQRLNEILEKARETELSSIQDITDTDAFSGVSDISHIQDALNTQYHERDRTGGRVRERIQQNLEVLKQTNESLEIADPNAGLKEQIRMGLHSGTANPSPEQNAFMKAVFEHVDERGTVEGDFKSLELDGGVMAFTTDKEVWLTQGSQYLGGAEGLLFTDEFQDELDGFLIVEDDMSLEMKAQISKSIDQPSLEQLFDQADQIMDKPVYSEVQDLSIEQVKEKLGTLDTQIKTLDHESKEYGEAVHASRQFNRAMRAEIERLDDQLNWDLSVYSPEFEQAEKRKVELKQILGSPTSQEKPTSQGITIDQLKAELEKAASRADELPALSPEHSVAVKWHVAIESALKAKEMELGLEPSTPEQADMDKGLPPGYSRDPAALEALLDAKGLHPVDKNQQPHPDIEFFQEIHEATEKHGDGDYGITDLELGEDYTLRSTYSGGRIFKDGETIVEFESPYSERGGIGHPIVVTGQVKPELKEFILEQVHGLEKSQGRSSTEPFEIVYRDPSEPLPPIEEPVLTLEDTLPEGYEDEIAAERYDPYMDVDPEIDDQYRGFMFDTVSSHLLENGIEQDGERWLELGSDYIASVSLDGDNLEISKDQQDGKGFKLAYVQQSAHESPTLNDLEPSEVMDLTSTVLHLEADRPMPSPKEIGDEFGFDIVESSDQGPKGGNNTNFLELTQSAVLDHGSMDKGEPPTISLELADGHTVTAWEDSVFISRENNGKANILYWGDRDEIKDLLTDEAKESITAGITGLNNRSLAQDFGVDVNRSPEQEISIFDMVAQPSSPIDMESMDAVIARDTYGTAVEILTPGPERDANEAKRIAAQFKEPPSQYALDVVEHLKQNSELDIPTTQVEKPFKATPDLEVRTGEATQKRHQANREFFDAMTKATTQHSEPSKGAHQLKLGNDLTSTVINDQLIISRDDGKGNQDVVYGHSRETAHLSGAGDGHIDRLSAQEKAGALKEVISLGKPKQRTVSRSSRARQDKSDSFDMDR